MSKSRTKKGFEIFTIKMVMIWLIKIGSYVKQALEIRRSFDRNPSFFSKK